MAAVDNSSSSSTSHTLTFAPPHPADTMATAAFLENLAPSKRHHFLQPSASIPTQSLSLVRDTLEGFAGDVADEQAQRLKKRKRGEEKEQVLKVRRVHVEGFETEQVWQQAKRVIEGVLGFADRRLDELQDEGLVAVGSDSGDEQNAEVEEVDSEDLEDEESGDFDEDDEEVDGDEDMLDMEAVSDEDEEGAFDDHQDDYQDEDDEEGEEYVGDPDGLNDGFFSLDEFNKQSQWFEDQDAKGDPNTDAASDDEQIDWNADPLAPSSKKDVKKSKAEDEDVEDEEGDSDDEGPTFGDMALDAPEGASDDEDEEIGNLEDGVDDGTGDLYNANDIYYKDFFAPPKKKVASKPKPKKTVSFGQPAEEDVNRAMADVKRDLFDSESEEENSEDALSDVEAGDPKARRSAHERRQAKLAEEIRKLEAESVRKREWAMSGEATAADRPTNSLLETDVDFEHGGKPVPVITPEVNETIEDLIKRRILSQEFDEVIRRRPGTDNLPNTRRGALEELDDTKGKSLAEVYEEEHAKQNNPDTYVSASDEKLQREEAEIANMWKEVSASLDALSSWHYTPKPVEPALNIVSDVATIAMEDAQPTTSAGMTGLSSSLAPQEIYSSNKKNAAKGEVVGKSGLPVAKQEMSKDDRQRKRRQDKARGKKAGGLNGGLSGKAKARKDTMDDLRKGGVKVVNRKGEVTDVQGNKVRNAKTAGSSSYKL